MCIRDRSTGSQGGCDMSSFTPTVSAPSTKMARQFWGEHHWDKLARAQSWDKYAPTIDVPASRLSAPIQSNYKPSASPVQLIAFIKEGSIAEIASALMRYQSLGGNVNERFTDDQLSPGVEELDTCLHVALRYQRTDAVRHLLAKGANPNIQNWHLETPRTIAERMGLEQTLPADPNQAGSTVWSTSSSFSRPKLMSPQRSVLEASYAWREGAPKTASPTKAAFREYPDGTVAVSYTHLRAHETVLDLVCRLLLEKKKKQ
eukprot:TRINITY_DN16272_c0_g1_i4.p1 TRINITY_DN16272_c0_g1~~TRINITY_DN16272_c0_g1_i4.p1  ORF type:complete len:260 (-),score=46.04 TRINITY_DN16272_c0_g1_i4:13-792(-)